MAACTPSNHVFLGPPLFLLPLSNKYDKLCISLASIIRKVNIAPPIDSHIFFIAADIKENHILLRSV